MSRGSYNTISDVDRKRLIKAYEENKDWISFAEHLNIKRQTAESILKTFRTSGRRTKKNRGGSSSKVDEEMKSLIIQMVEEKPTITLKELQSSLSNAYPFKPSISLQTISRTLEGELISLKDLRSIPPQWNDDTVKEERKCHMEWLTTDGLVSNLVFVDEFGINCWTARTKGRSTIGQRAVRITNRQRGQNLTFCVAISPQFGFIHIKFVVGGFCKSHFSDFLMEVDELLSEHEAVIICDNCQAHKNAPTLSDNHELRYLPRYSPFLNCAEMAGSQLKATVKRKLSEPNLRLEMDDHITAAASGRTLHAQRLSIILRELQSSTNDLSQQMCRNFLRHVMSYTSRCLRLEDIFD